MSWQEYLSESGLSFEKTGDHTWIDNREEWWMNDSKSDKFGDLYVVNYIYHKELKPYKEYISKEFKGESPLRDKLIYTLDFKVNKGIMEWVAEVTVGEYGYEKVVTKVLGKGKFNVDDVKKQVPIIMKKAEQMYIRDWKGR